MNNKLYDCFIYDGEEILDLRMKAHWDHFDYFIIVESEITFNGQKKELKFDLSRFSWAQEKIRYLPIKYDEMSHLSDAWARETYQRNYLIKGLYDASHEDTIYVSDVDELYHKNAFVPFSQGSYLRLNQLNLYFFCDYLSVSEPYINKAIAIKFSDIKKYSFDQLRNQSNQDFSDLKTISVDLAGWHFSYLGGTQEILRKLERFSHQEFNQEKYKDPNRHFQRIKRGLDIFGRAISWAKVDRYHLNNSIVEQWFINKPNYITPSEYKHVGDIYVVLKKHSQMSNFYLQLRRKFLKRLNRFYY